MDCLRDRKGKKICNLVSHPDKDFEAFCTECKTRFIKKREDLWGDFDGVWLVILVVAFLFLVSVLSGCQKQSKLLLIRISDVSASALNNPEQTKALKDACFAIADASKPGDQQALIEVSENLTATDPSVVKDQEQLYALCHQKPVQSKGQGTFVCDAINLSGEMIDRHSETIPLVVLQVQANERENFCPETLTNLAKKVSSRNGTLLVVGSTNDGNTEFNFNLWETLKDVQNTEFCNQNIRHCVKDSILNLRSNQE